MKTLIWTDNMHPNVTQALFTIAKYGGNLNIYRQMMDKEDVVCVCAYIYIWNLKNDNKLVNITKKKPTHKEQTSVF